MTCPNCKTRVAEQQAVCDNCGFHLAVVDGWLGTLPQPGPGLVDAAEVLGTTQRQQIRQAFTLLNERFPQVQIHALLLNLPRSVDLATCIFWLFNRGGFCPESVTGGNNHHVLLLLDTSHQRTACMVGYGLEPFVQSESLDQLARIMREQLAKGRPAGALEAAAEGLNELLLQAHTRALRGLGLNGREYTPPPSAADQAAAATSQPQRH